MKLMNKIKPQVGDYNINRESFYVCVCILVLLYYSYNTAKEHTKEKELFYLEILLRPARVMMHVVPGENQKETASCSVNGSMQSGGDVCNHVAADVETMRARAIICSDCAYIINR